jgi:deoxycytidine triphosphate deaminase
LVRRQDDKPLKIEPVSIDLHLSQMVLHDIPYNDDAVFLSPGEFCLGGTIETFAMPDFLVGFVVGKSTHAREGLQIEAAGLIDPGFFGNITLELKNLHHKDAIRLVIGEPIGQVYFMHLDEPTDVLYGPGNGNHYQGQNGVTPSHRK